MYRADHDAARARLDAQRTRQARAIDAVRERLDAIDALTTQLMARGQEVAPISAPDLRPTPTVADDASLGDLVRAAGEAEARAEALEAEAAALSRHFGVLGRQLDGKPTASAGGELAPGPRPVPVAAVVSEIVTTPWSFLAAAIFFPPALALPAVHRGVAVGVLALFAVVATGKLWRRIALLRWGRRAAIQVVDRTSTNTRYKNWTLTHATGWDVVRESYSGYGEKTTLAYLGSDGVTHQKVVRGRGYAGGVVLFDPRRPGRALGIWEFVAPPRPDHRGHLVVPGAAWPVWRGLLGLLFLGFVIACAIGLVPSPLG